MDTRTDGHADLCTGQMPDITGFLGLIHRHPRHSCASLCIT